LQFIFPHRIFRRSHPWHAASALCGLAPVIRFPAKDACQQKLFCSFFSFPY